MYVTMELTANGVRVAAIILSCGHDFSMCSTVSKDYPRTITPTSLAVPGSTTHFESWVLEFA